MLKTIMTDDGQVKMQIWDTAGQERFQVFNSAFFSGADACILVFDVHNAKSFEHLDNWYNEFVTNAKPRNPERFPFVLIGTKTDIEESRKVPRESIEQWRQSKGGIPYFETSAKMACSGSERADEESQKIEEAFMAAVRNGPSVNDNPDEVNEPEPALSRDAEPEPDNKDGCIVSWSRQIQKS